MALAPRPAFAARKPRQGSSTTDAPGKARQRARNKEAGSGIHAGSSGKAKRVADYEKVEWEELAEGAVHLVDIAGVISHSQIGASGWLVTTLNSPTAYAHDMLEAHIKGRNGMVYMRVYYVPIDVYLGHMEDSPFASGSELPVNGD